MKRSLFLSLTLALIIGSTGLVSYAHEHDGMTALRPGERLWKACSQEAKRCSDGSSVGRTGPNCEFAPCPGEATTTIQHRRDEFRATVELRREELQTRFDTFRREKITRMLSFMKQRFLAAIERLENIADRIEARIDKIEDETDTDLSEASEHLRDAHTHLDNAADALDAVGTTTDLFDAEAPGERFGRLRELFAEAKAEIKAARESLGHALRAIGQFHGKEKDQPATTTSSN